jgi:hypothetical protein
MKPAKLELPVVWRGVTYQAVTVMWKDHSGHPINLHGWLPWAQTRNFNLNASVTNPAQGITQVFMPKTQTLQCRLGTETWDWIFIQQQSPFYVTPPLLSGKLEIRQPTTDPAFFEATIVGGGSNYTRINQEIPNFPLLGLFHLHAAQIESQLKTMFANGQHQISVVVWFISMRGWPHPPPDRVWGNAIDCSTGGGDLYLSHKENLLRLLKLLNDIGFKELHLRFVPTGDTNDSQWPAWWQEQYLENKNFIVNTTELTQNNKGKLKVIYDLGRGAANARLQPITPPGPPGLVVTGAAETGDPIHIQYCTTLWRDFSLAFGLSPVASCAFSIVGGGIGAKALLTALSKNNLPHPAVYFVDAYDNEPTTHGVQKALKDVHDQLKAIGSDEDPIKPIYLSETLYNDSVVAQDIRDVVVETKMRFAGVHQWPRVRGLPLETFPDVYPKNFSAYKNL